MKFWDTGEETNTETFDFHREKKALIDNLNYLFAMSVQEQTLYKKWLEWNEEGRFKAEHKEPAIGYSLIMSPFNQFFTWQTTPITEIVEQKEDYLKFKTKNSTYELWHE